MSRLGLAASAVRRRSCEAEGPALRRRLSADRPARIRKRRRHVSRGMFRGDRPQARRGRRDFCAIRVSRRGPRPNRCRNGKWHRAVDGKAPSSTLFSMDEEGSCCLRRQLRMAGRPIVLDEQGEARGSCPRGCVYDSGRCVGRCPSTGSNGTEAERREMREDLERFARRRHECRSARAVCEQRVAVAPRGHVHDLRGRAAQLLGRATSMPAKYAHESGESMRSLLFGGTKKTRPIRFRRSLFIAAGISSSTTARTSSKALPIIILSRTMPSSFARRENYGNREIDLDREIARRDDRAAAARKVLQRHRHAGRFRQSPTRIAGAACATWRSCWPTSAKPNKQRSCRKIAAEYRRDNSGGDRQSDGPQRRPAVSADRAGRRTGARPDHGHATGQLLEPRHAAGALLRHLSSQVANGRRHHAIRPNPRRPVHGHGPLPVGPRRVGERAEYRRPVYHALCARPFEAR